MAPANATSSANDIPADRTADQSAPTQKPTISSADAHGANTASAVSVGRPRLHPKMVATSGSIGATSTTQTNNGSIDDDKNETSQAIARFSSEIEDLKKTVATFEAYFAITLMGKIDVLIEEKVKVATQPRRNHFIILMFAISFGLNVFLVWTYSGWQVVSEVQPWIDQMIAYARSGVTKMSNIVEMIVVKTTELDGRFW
ncbi:hypothetical protein U0C82_07385 [Fulvimarina sp. 2208YS6-2-32]|uniref:Transmembrane protein n=1 Tax=Fulvimarina uroteuthidis TaxID=3098149 RepID=A0ABU5I0W5_9HYPH|nr:hypothetical protein [Fulvimarina sp. 2208YS6-2-32]MDY8108965.1 hypothetical protein [Fulvimarina sp. 2208YS6-2-32]